MPSRHHLLAELEENRRKSEEAGVEVLSVDLEPVTAEPGYDPYDNPGAGKVADTAAIAWKPGRKKP